MTHTKTLEGFQLCSKCGELKPLSDYYFDKRRNKHRRDCKECHREYQKKRYKKTRDKRRSQFKEYYQNNKSAILIRHNAYDRVYNKQPMPAWKNKVRQDTRQLLLAGLLLHPGCCEECGQTADQAKLNIHHNSYLVCDDVTFLCEECHRDWHNLNPPPPEPDYEWVEEWYETKVGYPDVDGRDLIPKGMD